MPYEITFKKPLTVADPDIYINDCCWGGDIVRDQLLLAISPMFKNLQTGQEDWGWYIWYRHSGTVRLEINIWCDDQRDGSFRIHLISRKKGWLFFNEEIHAPEL